MKTMRLIGIMSGTSLDGVDLICVDFIFGQVNVEYHVLATHCYNYSTYWRKFLANAHHLNASSLLELDVNYGRFLGEKVKDFIEEYNLFGIDGIASHGHTIFHQPNKGFTLQIGHGAAIQAATKLKVISDFRSQDVALGGQGAPLVPIGDMLLFSEYDACINLGGFANVSYNNLANKRIAFDICPVNFVLNELCRKIEKSFDENGEIAKTTPRDEVLLKELNNLQFYYEPPPKSLGREWVEKTIYPILDKSENSVQTKISTYTHHAAFQISKILNKFQLKKVLFSGGGAKNSELLCLIKKETASEIIVLDDEITDYKEALVFALLGGLRLQNKTNIFSSVTGAEKDSCSGVIYL